MDNERDYSYENLVLESKKIQQLKKDCLVSTKLSLTGIINLVVNYEDPYLIDIFLRSCFAPHEIYGGAYDLDAIELQNGTPGRGMAIQYLDKLIYGSFDEENSSDGLLKIPKIDKSNGKRIRNPDGFINRKKVLENKCKDKTLIIKNIDYCLDFLNQHAKPGSIDPRALWIFDNFRNPTVKLGCRLLLITNEPLVFPFKVRMIKFEPIDYFEATHLLDSSVDRYKRAGYDIGLSDSQRKQIIRKLCGLTYSEAGDVLLESFSMRAEGNDNVKKIDANKVVKNLRSKVNRNLMQNATGLTCLTARPWNDYICPESSNFTYDVKKILRDISEINILRDKINDSLSSEESKFLEHNIEAIRSRMPHVILLYGRGGVGKSAFPIHLAGLLDFDVWDFNVTATHSKWVGEGPERMREAISKISKATHLVVRIDEYDRAIGASDSSGNGMHQAHKQVESEFMNWLQNSQEENLFCKNDIFVVLTTNHKENITGPLLRSGRIDLVIDINEFDSKSMKETFLSAPRRMINRGVIVAGYQNQEELEKAIASLDIERLSSLVSQKGFTVRDVDILIQEMSAHNYYYCKSGKGIRWTTENFVSVIENSVGSAKSESTSELVLGDRHLIDADVKDDNQLAFGFDQEYNNTFDINSFKNRNGFDLK